MKTPGRPDDPQLRESAELYTVDSISTLRFWCCAQMVSIPTRETLPDVQRCGFTYVLEHQNAQADIILVHGLNGHPLKTWKSEDGTFWPTELLPPYLKPYPANVLVYGYNADVYEKGVNRPSNNLVSEHAQTLVVRLAAFRQIRDSHYRPIIWISHSLGGLLVKKALVYANDCRSAGYLFQRAIYVSTYALIFLGTPHLGSDIAKWGRILHNLSKVTVVSRPFVHSEPVLIKTLKQNNQLLVDINDHFNLIMDRFRVHSAYELHKTKFKLLRSYVVDKESACIPHTISYGINADHSGMSKFSTESSSEFEAIGGAISSWTQEAYDIIGGRWSQELKDWNGWTQQNIDEMRIVSQMLLRMASGIATPPRASRRQHIPTDDHRTQNLPLEVTGPSGDPGEIQAYQGSVENPAPAPGSTMELDNPAYHQRNLRVLDQSISKSVSVDLLTSHRIPKSCFLLPLPKNTSFTGRAEMIRGMGHLLAPWHVPSKPQTQEHGIGKGNGTPTRLRICVLHGLPGIGKTNTAIEFAYRYRKHFTHIFWVSSDTEDKFEHDLCGISRMLQLTDNTIRQEKELIISAAMEWLKTPQQDVKWLLVLDNMDEARILNPLWVDLHQGSIIITSRGQVSSLHRLDCVERHFQLNELSPEEGTQLTQKLLNGRIEGLDPHAAADLAKRSQYYPLLIEQVTSFIGCSYSTMAEFTEEVGRGSTDRDLQHIHLDNPWSSGSVLDAIASHMHTLGSNNPMAVEILATIAFFDPDSIPEGMLYYPSGPVPILSSTISIKSLLGELSRRSFIARLPASEGRGASINMHRLVRDIVMHSTVPLQRPFEYAVALLRQSFPLQGMARDHMVEHWGRCEIFQPHVLSLHCHYLESQAHRDGEKVLRPSSDFVDLIYSCAWYLCERGRFNLGKSLVSSICDDCGKLYGTIHAAPKTLLADIYTVQLFYHNEVRHGMNLVELAKKALSLRESAVSEDLMKKYHPNRANGFMNVGVILAAESPRDAILYHKKALEIRLGSEEFASEQTLGLALNYLNIGRCWWIVGELEEAAGCLNESVALFRQRESVAGKRFSLSAMSLQSLGVVRADQGDLNSSLDLLSESLKLYIATLGGRHLKTLSCCYRFGWLWKLLRQFDLAEKHLQDCIDLYTSMMEGENPPRAELARSMYQLSRVLEEKNGFDSRCAELREDSCKLLEEVLSKQGNKSSARVEFTEADFDDAILYFYR